MSFRLVALVAVTVGFGLATDVAAATSPLMYGVARPSGSTWSLVNERGRHIRRLECDDNLAPPSPNGRRAICFRSGPNGGGQHTQLTRVNLVTGQASDILLALPDRQQFDYPGSWSPDSRRYVLIVGEYRISSEGYQSARSNLAVINVETGELRMLTDRPFTEVPDVLVTPTWLRDGRTIIYGDVDSDLAGGIHAIDATTGADRALTTTGGRDFAVSPNGRRIAYLAGERKSVV